MQASHLYLGLAVASVASALVSLSPELRIRMLRILTVLASYWLFMTLLCVDPWWRVLLVWGAAGLAGGVTCFVVDYVWGLRERNLQPERSRTIHWWLIPCGLIGWPDMLPQMIEFAAYDQRMRHEGLKQMTARRR